MHTAPINWENCQAAILQCKTTGTRRSCTYQVLIDYAVAGSEKRQDVRDEVSLLLFQALPVLHILGQVYLGSAREQVRNTEEESKDCTCKNSPLRLGTQNMHSRCMAN